MDIFESLNSVLVDLFNDILNIEERALITEEFKDISVTDMHIIEAVGIEEPRTMSHIFQVTWSNNGNSYSWNQWTCQERLCDKKAR